MQCSSTNEDVLRVNKMHVEYTVTGTEQAAHAARQRLDRILEDKLGSAFEGLFESLRAKGEGLWFIRRLACDLDVDLEFTDNEIATRWAKHLGQILARRLADGDDNEVVFFADFTAFLGRFLAGLVKGTAWSAWYNREFDGLKALPVPMALRTALLNEPATGLNALLSLDRADRARVLNALTPAEAHRTLEGFVQSAGGGLAAGEAELDTIINRLNRFDGAPVLVNETPWIEALDLYLRVVAERPASSGGHLQALLNLSSQQKALLMQRTLERSDSSRDDQERRFTPFGGVFLILPLLAKLALAEAVTSWPEPEGGDKLSALRLLLLAQCMGRERCLAVFRDLLVRDLVGASPTLTTDSVRQWLARITSGQRRHCQQVLTRWWLTEFDSEQVKVGHLRDEGRRLGLASAGTHGIWLFIRGCQPKRMQRFFASLKQVIPTSASVIEADIPDAQRIREDLEYLQLPEALRPTGETQWLTTCIAQSLLRDFAGRLPGFAASSLPYLYRNFLAIHANITSEPERSLVQLDRPPLNVILSMTGMARGHYRLDWLDERQLELYQDG